MSGQQDYGHARPRSRTMLSFGSNKSAGSGGAPKFTKDELYETSREKASRRISTKANPNVAMNEVEPVVQALMRPTMDSNLRGMQHRDMYGNVITDPDRSNPTRPRLERPLDTIRSFEAAIDGKYGRISSYSETPTPSRPASSYYGMDNPAPRRKSSNAYNGNSGFGNRSVRPDSYVDSSMYGSTNRRSPAPFAGPPRRAFGPGNRNNSDPLLYGNGMYTQPIREQYQPSYDSVGSSGGSGGTDNWNPSTDPSSPNSSVDRFQTQPPPPPKHDVGEQYGFTGFGTTPQTDFDYAQQQPRQNGYQNQYQSQVPQNQYLAEESAPPPPPPHQSYGQQTSSGHQGRSLQKTPSYGQQSQPTRPAAGDKRKSWLMRRFSKNQ